jgi:hypothetical protein
MGFPQFERSTPEYYANAEIIFLGYVPLHHQASGIVSCGYGVEIPLAVSNIVEDPEGGRHRQLQALVEVDTLVAIALRRRKKREWYGPMAFPRIERGTSEYALMAM